MQQLIQLLAVMVVHGKLAVKVTGLIVVTNEIWLHALPGLYKSRVVTGAHVGDNNLLNFQLPSSIHSLLFLLCWL